MSIWVCNNIFIYSRFVQYMFEAHTLMPFCCMHSGRSKSSCLVYYFLMDVVFSLFLCGDFQYMLVCCQWLYSYEWMNKCICRRQFWAFRYFMYCDKAYFMKSRNWGSCNDMLWGWQKLRLLASVQEPCFTQGKQSNENF